MHQPVQTKKVNHAFVLDGTDVEITRFVEYIDSEWLGEWQGLLNFSDVKFDIGHDTLILTTESVKENLVKFATKLSLRFPKIFMMYEFYTEDEEDFQQGTFYLLAGKITTEEDELLPFYNEV